MLLRGTASSLHFFGSVLQLITKHQITLSMSRSPHSSHLPTGYCRRLILCFAELPISQNRAPRNAVFQDVLAQKDFKVTVSSGHSANHSPLGDIPCSLRTLRSLTEKHLIWLSRLPKLIWTLSLLKWHLEALPFLKADLCSLLIYPQWGYFSDEQPWSPIWFLGSDFWETSLVTQTVKKPPAMRGTWVWSLGWEDSLEEGMATHFSIVAWRTPWTEEPGGLQSLGSQSQTQLSN